MRIERTTTDEAGTIALGAALAAALAPGDLVALYGELGTGKTRFVRGLAVGLGHPAAAVSSPTFVLMNEYDRPGATPLVHVDAFRLSGAEDLDALGWDEARGGDTVVVVEWAERIAADLPTDRVNVRISDEGGSARRIVLEASDAWSARLAALASG